MCVCVCVCAWSGVSIVALAPRCLCVTGSEEHLEKRLGVSWALLGCVLGDHWRLLDSRAAAAQFRRGGRDRSQRIQRRRGRKEEGEETQNNDTTRLLTLTGRRNIYIYLYIWSAIFRSKRVLRHRCFSCSALLVMAARWTGRGASPGFQATCTQQHWTAALGRI